MNDADSEMPEFSPVFPKVKCAEIGRVLVQRIVRTDRGKIGYTTITNRWEPHFEESDITDRAGGGSFLVRCWTRKGVILGKKILDLEGEKLDDPEGDDPDAPDDGPARDRRRGGGGLGSSGLDDGSESLDLVDKAFGFVERVQGAGARGGSSADVETLRILRAENQSLQDKANDLRRTLTREIEDVQDRARDRRKTDAAEIERLEAKVRDLEKKLVDLEIKLSKSEAEHSAGGSPLKQAMELAVPALVGRFMDSAEKKNGGGSPPAQITSVKLSD